MILDSDKLINIKTEIQTPVDAIDSSDPGDETQRNFRYQHGYGVILLVASIIGEKPYKAIWCEQHEDFLAERNDDLYDAYQIKTATPENGKWDLHSEALKHSIKKFVALHKQYGVHMNEYYFVSNNDHLESATENKIAKCPNIFLKHIQEIDSVTNLSNKFSSEFESLKTYCDCTDTELFIVLKKINLTKGPSRDDYESIISHIHISKIPNCSNFSAVRLDKITEELIYKIFDRSSIVVDSPSRHYYCLNKDDNTNPFLISKKISVDEIIEYLQSQQDVPFLYKKASDNSNIKLNNSDLSVMKRKMIKGGIASQIDIMERRVLSTEEHLVKLTYRSSQDYEKIINQLTSMVQGECDEIYLNYENKNEPFGHEMLKEVYSKLKILSTERPNMVYQQEYECLIGIAGLLTGDCKVKWSKTFNLMED